MPVSLMTDVVDRPPLRTYSSVGTGGLEAEPARRTVSFVTLVCRVCGNPIGPDEEYWQDGRPGVLCLDCGAEQLYGVTG